MSDAAARRILACYHARIPSTVIRLERPLGAWAERMDGAVRLLPEHRVGDADVLWADAVVIARPATIFSLRVARLARRWRRPLVVDLDDHLFAIPEAAASAEFYRQRATQRRMRKMLRAADAVALSTDPLRDALGSLCRRAVVIPNAAPPIPAAERPRVPEGETVALVASSDRLDCPALRTALSVLLPKCPGFSVICVGDAFADLDHPRIRRLPPMTHEAYLAWLAHEPISFALVPMARSPFHGCKSPIKFLDNAALGIPGLYAKSPAYESAIEPGCGMVIDDTPAMWTQMILSAAEAPDSMRAMAERARDLVRREHSVERAAERWEALLTSLPRPARQAVAPRASDLRVAVFAPEPIDSAFRGPNLRAIAIARELAREFAATLIVPEATDLLRGEPFAVEAAGRTRAADTLSRFDVAISTGLAYPASTAVKARAFQLFDLCDPVLFEAAAGSGQDGASARFLRRLTRLLLLTGDHFLCASGCQRDLWLGALYVSGRPLADLNRPGDLISVVPFGAAVGQAPKMGILRRLIPGLREGDRVVVWSGGLWDWFDPLTLIRALAIITRSRSDVKLLFLGATSGGGAGEHTMGQRARDLAAELGLLGTAVHLHTEWLRLDDLGSALAEADLAVCTASDTAENRFAARIRLSDAVAAQIPIVCTRGSAMADFIEEREIGLTCAPGDAADVAVKILAALEPAAQERMRGALSLCGDTVRWERCAEPVCDVCRRIASGEILRVPSSAATRWGRYLRYKLPCILDRLASR